MADGKAVRLHILHCGTIRVSPSVAIDKETDIKKLPGYMLTPDRDRVTLPVSVYLIEHPRGLILVDTGWCREISPLGSYDEKAARSVLLRYMASLLRPTLPAGEAVHEQLAVRGIRPEDLDLVILTHLDPDHTAGLRHVARAKRMILPEDEYFWTCRQVYKHRQVWPLWENYPIEKLFYRGSQEGPNRWAIDLFGDESLLMVNTPGHTDGHASILLRGAERFAVLAGDAAYSPRNWREMQTPGFGFDGKLWAKSLRWLAEKEQDPRCAGVFCSHDPDIAPQTIEL